VLNRYGADPRPYAGSAMIQKSPPVMPGAGVPLHRQLFLVLRDEIARGAIPVGDPLPTKQTLCEQFGVSRITVRRALADLADQGYIERRHGVGSFVRRTLPSTQQVGGSVMDELRQTQFETEAEVLEFGLRTPPPAVADKVQFDGDALHITRVRRERHTGEPLMVTEAWLPAALADAIDEDELGHAPLYDLLSTAGVTVDSMEHEFTAEIAGPRYAQLLDTAIGTALLRVNRVAFSAGNAHHLLSILLSPNRSRIVVSQSAEELDTGGGFAIAHDVRQLHA
jgi:GntR family transcriptional regulator